MFSTRWKIFSVFGIPFFVHISWLLIAALLTWTLADVFRQELPDQDWSRYGIMGLAAALAFFVCILLHEAGHALVARYYGMPVRGITLFMFGGVAELGREPDSAWHEFAMAIAGPLVSLVLAIGFGLAGLFGTVLNWPTPIYLVLNYLAAINLTVLIFNMIPAFPLDGGRVLRSVLWGATGKLERATYWASLGGQGFAWFLMAMGIVQFITGNVIGGIWLGLIGLFLHNAARGAYQQVLVEQALEGEPVRQFMNAAPVVVPPSLDLRHLVEDFVYRHHRQSFPVVADGHVKGIVSVRDLGKCPREQWERHTVGELMHRNVKDVTIAPDAEALEALRQMQRTGARRLLVVEDDHLLGIVSLSDLRRFLQFKLEVEEAED
jgi:Zn-dependent protease